MQSLALTAPGVALYLPARHLVQLAIPGGLHSPKGQQVPAPALLLVPATHCKHAPVELPPVEGLYLPRAQLEQLDGEDPPNAALNFPRGHATLVELIDATRQ